MPTFSYVPEFGATKDKKPRVSNIKFGDGYEQRVRSGINTNPEVWRLSFANRDEAEKNGIDNFLTDLGGASSFDWTPPGQSTARKFKCQEWLVTTVKNNLFSISATFEEVFE